MVTKKPIVVLFDARPITDANKSGVGYYTLGLVSALAKTYPEDVKLVGFTFDFLGRNHKKPPALGNNVEYISIKFVPGKILSLFRLFGTQPPIEFFIRKKTDIQLYTNFVSLPSLRKTPKVSVIYDLVFFDYPQYVQKRNLRFLQKFVPGSVKRSDLIITISEFTKQRIAHYYPKSNAEVVVTPIPPVAASAVHTNDVAIPKRLAVMGVVKNGFILYLGTIEPRKNVENLVKAYALLPADLQSKYALVLAGGKGWKDESILQRIATEQKLGRNIIMPGYISDEEKQALYANASLYTLPSHYEGFGMPVLEAMQQKVPVALSDIPVFHEVAGVAAFYFNKDDPQNIADVLAKALTDTQSTAKMLTKAAAKLKEYNWEHNAKIVFESLAKLLSK